MTLDLPRPPAPKLRPACWAVAIGLAFTAGPALAAETFAVAEREVGDPKAVFATVESVNVVPARARIGGTVVSVDVRAGDKVAAGKPIATVVDDKLDLQVKSLDAEIAGLEAQRDKFKTDLDRADDLFRRGTIPRSQLDAAQTQLDVAIRTLEARVAARSVIGQQIAEGAVLAPTAGRVLEVPVTVGTVVLPGEPIASVAEENFVLRLRVPERHARSLKVGDTVRLDAAALPAGAAATGTIELVYPKIEDGRVVADARVSGLGDYFVGERIRVFVSSETRAAFVVPAAYIVTRYGVDYVMVASGESAVETPVQRGQPLPVPDLADGVEILSGVKSGDVLVHP